MYKTSMIKEKILSFQPVILMVLGILIYAEAKNFESFFSGFMVKENALIFSVTIGLFGIVGSFYDRNPKTSWLYGFCIGGLFLLSYGNLLIKTYDDAILKQNEFLREIPSEPKKPTHGCWSLEPEHRGSCLKRFADQEAIYLEDIRKWENKVESIKEENEIIKNSPNLVQFKMQLAGILLLSVLLGVLNWKLSGILSEQIRFNQAKNRQVEPVAAIQESPKVTSSKQNGSKRGRKPKIDYKELADRIKPLRESGLTNKSICESLGISTSALFRSLKTFP